jgi:hypothetical protein
MEDAMKIQVETRHDGNSTTAINAHGDEKHAWISRSQYNAAARRLGMIDGDSLRLSPVGDSDPSEVVVYDHDGKRLWAVIL